MLCLCSGCVWRRGSARGGAVRHSAVAGRAVPAPHERGGAAGQTEQSVKEDTQKKYEEKHNQCLGEGS